MTWHVDITSLVFQMKHFFSNKLASRVISKIILIVLLRISSKYIRYQPSFFFKLCNLQSNIWVIYSTNSSLYQSIGKCLSLKNRIKTHLPGK